MAKGIELPVNVLVIIVIAVLVLIALATLVATGILSLKPVQVMLEKNSACAQYGCGAGDASKITLNINVDKNEKDIDTLEELCVYDNRCTVGAITGTELKKYCGCPI